MSSTASPSTDPPSLSRHAATVYIEADWGKRTFTGSGFLLGKNDVVTAAHVIYSQRLGGFADDIRVYPGYDPTALNQPFFHPVRVEGYTNFDRDGDGRSLPGDFNRGTRAESENDIALLSMGKRLARTYGRYRLRTAFRRGRVTTTGYPARNGRRLTTDTGTVFKDPANNVFLIDRDLEVSPGSSGGPILRGDDRAVGLISTAIAATRLRPHRRWLRRSMERNDRFLGSGRVEGSASLTYQIRKSGGRDGLVSAERVESDPITGSPLVRDRLQPRRSTLTGGADRLTAYRQSRAGQPSPRRSHAKPAIANDPMARALYWRNPNDGFGRRCSTGLASPGPFPDRSQRGWAAFLRGGHGSVAMGVPGIEPGSGEL